MNLTKDEPDKEELEEGDPEEGEGAGLQTADTIKLFF